MSSHLSKILVLVGSALWHSVVTAAAGVDATTKNGERPAVQIRIVKTFRQPVNGIAFDDRYTYLSVGRVIYRSATPKIGRETALKPLLMGPCTPGHLDPAGSGRGYRARMLIADDKRLFVFGETTETQNEPTEHSLCVSADRGKHFIPIDSGLKYCFGAYCQYMGGDQLAIDGDRLYLNAGGAPNLQVSADLGAHWGTVMGSLEPMACYSQKFEIIGSYLLTGGECPLDSAYIRRYRLRGDGLGLESGDPIPMTLPDLSNRMVQFIKRRSSSNIVFAGVEGGLLRSEDGGTSFDFVLRYEAVTASTVKAMPVAGYPYIQQIAFRSSQPEMVVVGGFDKSTGGPFLAYSRDTGLHWLEISGLLGPLGTKGNVHVLAEGPTGQLFVGGEQANGSGYLAVIRID